MSTNPQRSENTDHNFSLQESMASMVQHPIQRIDQTDVRHGIQSLSLSDQPHSHDPGNNRTPIEYEVYSQTPIHGHSVSIDGESRTVLEVGDSRGEICIGGSSFNEQFWRSGVSSNNASASHPDHRFSPAVEVPQRRPFRLGLLGGNPTAQNQLYQQNHWDTVFTEPTRLQTVSQQQNRNENILSILGRVKSPLYADLPVRLDTFIKWPLDIRQTPHKVAEAGFYYTGFQDVVRCFACDGGLKNWDDDDDPWIEHARWFPQCAYVRHIKGEEFINLVRMSTEESDEEDDNTVHRGATWRGAEHANTNPDSVSNKITEPSVLESKDAQAAIEMGYLKKDVAMAINDIFKKGKQDFTVLEIVDSLLEKEINGELSNYKQSANCLPSHENRSVTEQAMSMNKQLKELLHCRECKTKQRNILFLPCTHHIVCESCSDNLQICTCCYRKIKEKVRTYMS
ncbi:hypothetical protein ACJMK2_029477 [Sinanodonta woodiana]|uniref:RING-type domain-containing protein n=1 Tax=Sinanodonta woodiana TaxID=1069815 RepID=A0ABD3XC56_SINWO